MLKTIVLTVNFELFFGRDSGTVENTMIRPIKQLVHLLEKYDGKMTVYWDILHFWKLKQLENKYASLRLERELIEKQIKQIIKSGHDVQMLIYPHWLSAKWEGDFWSFDNFKLKLQQLSPDDNKEEIRTIKGCINIASKLMEKVIQEVLPCYKVSTIRLGGGRVVPFGPIKEALLEKGIIIENTVCPGVQNRLVNFKSAYITNPYRFAWSVFEPDDEGEFMEVPITSVYFPFLNRLYNAWIHRTFYAEFGRFGDGTISGDALMNPDYKEDYNTILTSKRELFTPEGCYRYKWLRMLNKVNDFSVTLVSVKNLNPYTISMLDESLNEGLVRFVSLDNYLSNF